MRMMKFRVFLHFEAEEKWLNEMAQKGWNFVKYKFGRFYFEKGTPGEFIYRLEMLDERPGDKQSKEYIEFMKENGIEMVDSYNTWVYFRKRAEDGPFEIYTDIPSRIKHYKKIANVFGIVALINLSIALINLNITTFNQFLSIINFIAAIILLIPYIKLGLQIKHLIKENKLFD